MSNLARENILRKVRDAQVGHTPGAEAMRNKLAQHPRGPLPLMAWEMLPRFRDRCQHLSSTVDEIQERAQLVDAVASYLNRLKLARSIVCWSEHASLNWAAAGIEAEARPAKGDDQVGVTGVFCAIAETGTLMLLSDGPTPLVNSLVPETHIAVVPLSRVVRNMEDGFDLMRRERAGLPRQVTFISGPSRTADIELTLVLGIHGPGRVHIIVDRSC